MVKKQNFNNMNLIFEGDIFESQADEEDIESKMDKESLTVEDH